jgi:maleamate amidohydrolase
MADGLSVQSSDLLITKQYPSAFFGTSLASTLQFHKIDTLIIGGLTTSGCVRATCIDSISSGFVTLIAHQACGDRANAPHEANLFDMSAKYADLITTKDVTTYIQACVAA